ncbi:hypothetical protein [Streptomyces sp. SID8499]|uniref:hypothetical protein n=1 Tax=Streptomyces sp. SID8499 TaxID=2706106 RepID=UPI0013C9168C|nr:hypothetical protein [Streptomyces sp. SID8499]NED31076.1 hypothetical protein [Streptomyces sp. SID8499]
MSASKAWPGWLRPGYVPIMLPAQVAGDRWLARAVPANDEAPTREGRGSVVSG